MFRPVGPRRRVPGLGPLRCFGGDPEEFQTPAKSFAAAMRILPRVAKKTYSPAEDRRPPPDFSTFPPRRQVNRTAKRRLVLC